jgi:hypothetical protein
MEAHKSEKSLSTILRGPKEGKVVSMGGVGVIFKLFGKYT